MGSSSKWVWFTLQLHCDCPPFSGFSLAQFRSSLKKHGCQFLDIISSVCFISPKIPSFSLCVHLCVIWDSWGSEPCSNHLLEQEDVDMVNALDKENGITLEDFKLIKMHMADCMISFFYVFLQSLSYLYLFPFCPSTVLFSNLLFLAIAYDYHSFTCSCVVRF